MKLLFVQGPEKTATSTVTGILNCHPEIFVLFETYIGQPLITKYGNQLLEKYPEARKFFRSEDDYGKPVIDFFQYLKNVEPGYDYTYVGTKINNFDPKFTQKKKNHKIIFTKRDLRSWLVKQSVIERYRTDLDVVIPSIEYLRYIIHSSQYSHAFHLWLEDLIEDHDKTISSLSSYLNVNLKPHVDHWWERIGYRNEEDPKSIFHLKHIHHSSRVKPNKLDTEFELKRSEFWFEVTQVFDKYFRTNDYRNISKGEMNEDLEAIDRLNRFAPLPFQKAYEKVNSLRLGYSRPKEVYFISGTDKEGKKRSLISRIVDRVKRIIDVGFKNYHITKGLAYGIIFFDEAELVAEILLID